jgi:hypothetical protein
MPDFYVYNIPKRGKIYQITTKYIKLPQNIPNGHKIDFLSLNIPTSSIARPSKIYPNCDFWSENKPSGNPDVYVGTHRLQCWRGNWV